MSAPVEVEHDADWHARMRTVEGDLGEEDCPCQRERQWREFEAAQLAKGLCPNSGDRLLRDTDEAPDGLACNVCDCFGYAIDADGRPVQ